MDKHKRKPAPVFWRFCLRSAQIRRPQALLAVGALLAGAAICSLLLNLYGGVQRKMTQSFSAFGANVILAPRSVPGNSSGLTGLMPEPSQQRRGVLQKLVPGIRSVPELYAVARLSSDYANPQVQQDQNVIAVGTHLLDLWQMYPAWRRQPPSDSSTLPECAIGRRVAAQLELHRGDELTLKAVSPGVAGALPRSVTYHIQTVVNTGAAEDNQVFVPLESLQKLVGAEGKVSTVELRVPGNSSQISTAIHRTAMAFPGLEVRPVRQIVYSEGKVLSTLRRLTVALTVLILVIIGLCVMATMTAIVIERRKDVALMKALGASDRVVMELFLAEAAMLGLLGGLAGFALGAVLAHDVAQRLFHVALAPSGWVFPMVCLASVALALIATLLPVQMVRRIQPAVALKGA